MQSPSLNDQSVCGSNPPSSLKSVAPTFNLTVLCVDVSSLAETCAYELKCLDSDVVFAVAAVIGGENSH